MGLTGLLSFAAGGAILVVSIGLVVGDALHAVIGGGFIYGAIFAFLAFILMGMGGELILRSLESEKKSTDN